MRAKFIDGPWRNMEFETPDWPAISVKVLENAEVGKFYLYKDTKKTDKGVKIYSIK